MKKSTLGSTLRRLSFLVALLQVGTGAFDSRGDTFVFEGPGYQYTCDCWTTWDDMWDCECWGWETPGSGGIGGSPESPTIRPIADASATPRLVISPNGVDAIVTLDGSRSYDLEGDPIFYSWFLGDVYLGTTLPQLSTNAVAPVTLPVGTNW